MEYPNTDLSNLEPQEMKVTAADWQVILDALADQSPPNQALIDLMGAREFTGSASLS